MKLLKSLTLGAALLVSGTTFAQTVDQIIASHKKAMGGEKVYENIKTMYTEGSMSTMGMEMPMKVYTLNKEGVRVELEVFGSKNVTVFYKKAGWMLSPAMGIMEPQDLPADKLEDMLKQSDLSTDLYNYAAKGWKVTLAGKQNNAGQEEYKLHMTNSSGKEMDVYVDTKTYYINHMEVVGDMEGEQIKTDVKLSDYKKTPEGLVLPTTITNGDMFTVKLDKVELNKKLDEALFMKPTK